MNNAAIILKTFFNPFERIAGFASLSIGIMGILASASLFYAGGFVPDALLHISLNPGGIGWGSLLVCQFAIWLLPASAFYILGLAFSRSKIRAVDVYGMTAFAQLPLAAVALLMLPDCVSQTMGSVLESMTDPVGWMARPEVIAGLTLAMLSLLPIIWMLVLMFQALKVSCNLSGWRQWVSYACGLLGGDIASRIALYFLVFASVTAPIEVDAKTKSVADPALAGYFEGTLDIPGRPLRFGLEISLDGEKYTLTARSPDQGNAPIPVSDFSVTPQKLEFKIPRLNISYSGKFDAKKDKVRGTFFQGVRIPLNMERQNPKAAKPNFLDPDLAGKYEGALKFPGQKLRFVLELSSDDGKCEAAAFSPDQSDKPIPVEKFSFTPEKCEFAIESLGIAFEGKADKNSGEIKGRFTQHGAKIPLTLKKK